MYREYWKIILAQICGSIGGEGTIAEGHVSMTETFPTIPLGNIFTDNNVETITDAWEAIYTQWEKVY